MKSKQQQQTITTTMLIQMLMKVIAIIERIVHYLNECFNETKYIFNSPLVFKRVRDYVSG